MRIDDENWLEIITNLDHEQMHFAINIRDFKQSKYRAFTALHQYVRKSYKYISIREKKEKPQGYLKIKFRTDISNETEWKESVDGFFEIILNSQEKTIG